MKKHPEFLIWFAVVTVTHFLICWLLGLVLFNANSTDSGLALLVLALCVKGLTFPLGWILHSGDTERLSIWMELAVELFNSVIWGAIIAFIISLMKKRRSRLDAF